MPPPFDGQRSARNRHAISGTATTLRFGTHFAASQPRRLPRPRRSPQKRGVGRMRSLIFGTALAALILGQFASASAADKCEPAALATKYPSLVGKTIKVAQDPQGGPPYSFRDPENFDNLVGLDAELVRAAFACIGVPFEFKTGSWSGLLPSVIAGQADLMWSNLYYTPARAEQVDFVTYLLAATRGIVRKGNPKNVHSLDDACGVRAAAGLGTVEEAMFRGVSDKCAAAGKPPLEIVTYPDRPTGIRMLLNDRADLMMGDAGGGAYTIKLNPNDLESGYVILTDYKVGPGIGKSSPELRRAIFDAMQLLQADGTQKALMLKYGVDPELQRPVEMHTN
jgi:polar amino acid transport system substrate-binding protein